MGWCGLYFILGVMPIVCAAIPFPQPAASLDIDYGEECTHCNGISIAAFAPILSGFRDNMLRGYNLDVVN